MKITQNGKITILIIAILSLILLKSNEIIAPTFQFNFSSEINIFSKEGDSCTSSPVMTSYEPSCGSQPIDKTGNSALDTSDNIRLSIVSGASEFDWISFIANINFTKGLIRSFNWTIEGCEDNSIDNQVSVYIRNYTTGTYDQIDTLFTNTCSVEGDQILTYNFTNATHIINSSNGTTLLIHANTAGADFSIDFAKLEVTYNDPPTISIVSDFSYLEDSTPLILNLTGNKTDTDDSSTSLFFNLSSNDTTKVNIFVINLTQNLFSLNLSGNATGPVNISILLNDSLNEFRFGSFVMSITGVNDPPSIPLLNSPSNQSTIGSTSPTFSWFNSSDVENNIINYTLEIYNHSVANITNLIYNRTKIPEIVSPTSHTINTTLIAGTYYWRIFSYDVSQSDYSEERSLTININYPSISNETTTPLVTSIINFTAVRVNATVFDDDNNLDEVWLESDYITPGTFVNYTGNHITNITSNYTFFMEALNVTNHKTIKWRYWANDSTGNLVQGNTQQFIVKNMPPNATLNSPDNQSTIGNTFVLLSVSTSDWDNDTVKVEFYGDSQVNPTALLNTTNFTAPGSTMTFNWTGRTNGITYYWRVKAIDNQNTSSDYSDQRTFTIDTGGVSQIGGGGGSPFLERILSIQGQGLVCEELGWNARTRFNSDSYTAWIAPKQNTIRNLPIIFRNNGTKTVNINARCAGFDCALVNITPASISLEPNANLITEIDVGIRVDNNTKLGDEIDFSIILSDNEECEGPISYSLSVSYLGYLWKSTRIANVRLPTWLVTLPVLVIMVLVLTFVFRVGPKRISDNKLPIAIVLAILSFPLWLVIL